MKVLKNNPIVDSKFLPNENLDFNQYFSRAMLFAQTNYKESLSKLANANFIRLVPTVFFEEYAWNVCCINSNPKEVSVYFDNIVNKLLPHYRSFWEDNNFPEQKLLTEYVISIIDCQDKNKALTETARIINSGIKLFTWKHYRSNFLNSCKKLEALPMITENNSSNLASDIGLSGSFNDPLLQVMAKHWNFLNPEEMCETLSKQFVMQPKVIGLALWYTGNYFGFNCSST